MIKKIKPFFSRIVYMKQPTFIISYKYFTRSTDNYIKAHRAVFLKNFKRVDLVIINLLAIFKWVVYFAWVNSYRVSKNTTKEKLCEASIKNRSFLFLRLLKLSLTHFIAPSYYFKYKLYKNNPLGFFYSKENSLLHLYSDRNLKASKKDSRLISDKYAFLNFLEEEGIQTNYSYKAKANKILTNSADILFKKTKIFCKPNIANRSIGALYIDYNNSNYQLTTLVDKKQIVGKDNILAFLKSHYSKDQDILVETFLEDYIEIKKLSQYHNDATTLRIITASIDSTKLSPQVIYTQLEIPLLENDNKQQFYNILPLDINTLDIDLADMPDFKDKANFENIKIPLNLKNRIRSAINKCLEAHKKLNIRAVAFDIIISSKEEIIIEANYNWDIEILYRAFSYDQNDHIAKVWLDNL
ncbi:hypothetical protein E4K63_01530 [Allofrancisella inopinata]|uniref:Alpha-L-glutamate ligase-related protein ATP-grasp domain-containing protein n=2 Tax=Allofrancisella inopinata TaxID=1085647 RepID=A0AAE6YHK9_9GAMM|nr:hypothetical protein [Allofrancisella inopinata]QIV95587.1 hypothetical protein E4K63_01530 [Allofrancisella inopinata]